MLITSQPHPRARRAPPSPDLGKSIPMRQALARLAVLRPHAVVLGKRRAK